MRNGDWYGTLTTGQGQWLLTVVQDRKSKQGNNNVKALTDLKVLAKNALDPIEKKLSGIYTSNGIGHPREISTNNLVQMVIQEATDPANLVRQVDPLRMRRTLIFRTIGENVSWLGAASVTCKDGRLQSPRRTDMIFFACKT